MDANTFVLTLTVVSLWVFVHRFFKHFDLLSVQELGADLYHRSSATWSVFQSVQSLSASLAHTHTAGGLPETSRDSC